MVVEVAKDLSQHLDSGIVGNLLENAEGLTFSISIGPKEIVDVTVLFKKTDEKVMADVTTSNNKSASFKFIPEEFNEPNLNLVLEKWLKSLGRTSIKALAASGRNIHFTLTENGRKRQIEVDLSKQKNGETEVKISIDTVHRFWFFDGMSAATSSYTINKS